MLRNTDTGTATDKARGDPGASGSGTILPFHCGKPTVSDMVAPT